MEGIVRRPFQLQRPEGPVPHQTLRMQLPDGEQLPLKIALAHLMRRLELNVVRGDGVLHADRSAYFLCFGKGLRNLDRQLGQHPALSSLFLSLFFILSQLGRSINR